MDLRDVSTLTVTRVGRLETTTTVIGLRLVDGANEEILPASEFLSSLLASGASQSSLRSYAMGLLRWWRFLEAVGVPWDRATRIETRDFVLWMRSGGKRPPDGSPARSPFAAATINHNLAVLRGFYGDRLAAGVGPVINPVPDSVGGNRPHAHQNPMQPFEHHRRAPLRQRTPARQPKGLPDRLFDDLFAAMVCDRDRALLAFYVTTGARASELLGVTVDRVDVGQQLIGVHRKGSGALQWLPASSDAFIWLRLYEAVQSRPEGESALWLTRREPTHPLTYSAMRRVLQRANAHLGQTWTLHQLRHTAAQRMVDDPRLSLIDVQWLLGHAHLETTEIYVRPHEDEVVARAREHHQRRAVAPTALPAAGYRPEVMETLLGGRTGVV
jgi:site-specific recombinase XerD